MNMLSLFCSLRSTSAKHRFFDCVRSVVLVVCISLFASACATTSTDTQQGSSGSGNASEDVFILSQNAQRAYTQSRWMEAVQLYQRVVERVPNDADAWFRLANTYAQQGAYERAIHAYETSLFNNSQQPKAWFNLSTAYLLNAQSAMRQSYDRMRSNDPARAMIDTRLVALGDLLHGRIEDSVIPSVHTAD